MSEIIRIHHEDWDFAKLFGDLKEQGVKSVRLQLPQEWEDDEKIRVEKTTELLKIAEEVGVNIKELVPHKREASTVKGGTQNIVNKNNFGPIPVASNGHLKLYLIIGGILSAMVVAGGVVLSQRAFREQKEQMISPAAAASTIAVTPSPSPTPILNRSDLTVRVLNGSGKRGVAGELGKYLTELGYSVAITGNTNIQAGSKLRLKSGSENYRDILTADLGAKFEVASGSGLPQVDVVGAEIIIGMN